MKEMRILLWGIVVVAAVALGGIYLNKSGDAEKSRTATGANADIELGGPFQLTSHTGELYDTAALTGQFQLIYFGYTFCPDVCPLELQKMTSALRQMEAEGVDTSLIQPLFVSVDPERDTPETLNEYVGLFHDRLVGLTGDPEDIRRIAKEYRIYYGKRVDDDNSEYLMDHTSLIFLMGKDGKMLEFFSVANTPEDIKNILTPLVTG